MLISLQEFVVSPCARVDREAGVIRDVKVLGYASANGRRYAPEAVRRAIGLYEGIRVNVDHPPAARPEAERPLAARFGVLKNVAVGEEGLFGDLHYLRSHPLAELALEAAERLPEALGLSHNAEGRVASEAGQPVVEEIVRVRSVDLVADPATTRSLFEGVGGSLRELHEAAQGTSGPLAALVETLASLADDDQRQALIDALAQLAQRPARHGPHAPARRFSPRTPRSSEPFREARPGAFPADPAAFIKALR